MIKPETVLPLTSGQRQWLRLRKGSVTLENNSHS